MNNALIYFLLVKIIVVSSGITLAQDFKLDKPDTTEWNEGTVSLADGKVIAGLLKLNTRTGLLAYENGATSRSLTPAKVLGFEFFDRIRNKKRSFISVNYEEPSAWEKKEPTGTKNQNVVSDEGTPKFFEILMELKTFALLSSFEKLEYKSKAGGYNPATNMTSPTVTEYAQTETLYIFDPDGKITPVLDVTNNLKETESPFTDLRTKTKAKSQRDKTKTKNLDNEIIEKHTAPHFEALEEFAKENNLSFKRKDDLLKIFEHYKKIESN